MCPNFKYFLQLPSQSPFPLFNSRWFSILLYMFSCCKFSGPPIYLVKEPQRTDQKPYIKYIQTKILEQKPYQEIWQTFSWIHFCNISIILRLVTRFTCFSEHKPLFMLFVSVFDDICVCHSVRTQFITHSVYLWESVYSATHTAVTIYIAHNYVLYLIKLVCLVYRRKLNNPMETLKKTASFIDVATAIYLAYIICKKQHLRNRRS